MAEAAYITLEDAAALEGISYEAIKKRAQRNPEKLGVCKQERDGAGKDITLVSVNSLSKQARNAYKERKRLEGLAVDASDLETEDASKPEIPWYVDTDIDWFIAQYKNQYYKAMELGNIVREFLQYEDSDRTGYAETFARERIGKGARTMYRYQEAYLEASAWADKKSKEDGCSYDYFKVLALCRKPKDVGAFPSLKPEVKQTIQNIWFDKEFAQNRPTKDMLYEKLTEIAKTKNWKLPSYQTVVRYINFLMTDEGMKNAYFLVANGSRQYKNKVLQKRRRDTKSLKVLEMIQGDEHTFDCWVTWKAPNGKIMPIRPKLVCWIDTRSRVILGDIMCKDGDSDILKQSLLKLIYHDAEGHVPQFLYIDNGKDYTSKEMLGIDRKDRHNQEAKDEHFEIAFDDAARGFYKSIGIQDEHISMPYEPWTKGQIERFFRTVCNKFTKWLTSYTGTLTGSLTSDKVNKDIKRMAEQGKLLTIEQFYEYWKQWKEEKYLTRVHRGLKDAGETYTKPGELWKHEEWYEKAAPPKSMATMLMMVSKSTKVYNTGVKLNNNYYNSQEVAAHIDETVDVKYDKDDMSVIYVFDKKGKLIGSAECQELLKFGKVADETLQQHRRNQNAQIRRDREIAKRAQTPFEELNRLANESKEAVGTIDLMIEAETKPSKVVQMPTDNTFRKSGKDLKEAKKSTGYRDSQAKKALERLQAIGEA